MGHLTAGNAMPRKKRATTPKINVGGVWKTATPKIRAGGVWDG